MEALGVSSTELIPIPGKVEIADGFLVYDQSPAKYTRVRSLVLDDFLNIKTDQDILQFARRWGALCICHAHDVPGCCVPEETTFAGWPAFQEPLYRWHRIVEIAKCFRSIGESIQNGGTGSEEDWIRFTRCYVTQTPRPDAKPKLRAMRASTGMDHWDDPWKSKVSARRRLSREMSSWLQFTRPAFLWENHRWILRTMASGNLFGHLAVNLASGIAGGMQSAFCSFCGGEYFPKRRPTEGQLNQCGKDECKRDYWKANKRAKNVARGKLRNAE